MSQQTETKENIVATGEVKGAPVNSSSNQEKEGNTFSKRDSFKKNQRRPQKREARVKPEFDNKLISIRRVTRVVAGGRRFSFSVSLVLGNRKGSVGVGMGKANDTSLAIEKAMRDAKKNMITLKLNKNMSIPYEVRGKFASSIVTISPAPGRGLIAGSSVRNVIELAGIKEINAKILSRSKNKFNNARSAIVALSKIND